MAIFEDTNPKALKESLDHINKLEATGVTSIADELPEGYVHD